MIKRKAYFIIGKNDDIDINFLVVYIAVRKYDGPSVTVVAHLCIIVVVGIIPNFSICRQQVAEFTMIRRKKHEKLKRA